MSINTSVELKNTIMNGNQNPDARFHYLIPNKVDELYGCTVSTAGMQTIAPDSDYPSADHPVGYMFNPSRGRVLREYQLLYIVNGKGVFSNAGGNHEVMKGSVILLRPGEWHTYKPVREIGWTEYFIGCNDVKLHIGDVEFLLVVMFYFAYFLLPVALHDLSLGVLVIFFLRE